MSDGEKKPLSLSLSPVAIFLIRSIKFPFSQKDNAELRANYISFARRSHSRDNSANRRRNRWKKNIRRKEEERKIRKKKPSRNFTCATSNQESRISYTLLLFSDSLRGSWFSLSLVAPLSPHVPLTAIASLIQARCQPAWFSCGWTATARALVLWRSSVWRCVSRESSPNDRQSV